LMRKPHTENKSGKSVREAKKRDSADRKGLETDLVRPIRWKVKRWGRGLVTECSLVEGPQKGKKK